MVLYLVERLTDDFRYMMHATLLYMMPLTGNVEVLIYDWRSFVAGWRSVCDIGWTKRHAEAVCRQLGFPGEAVATKNGRFGFSSSEY